MDHLPPVGWADLARRGDVEHATALLRADMAALAAELRGEMALMAAELRGEMAIMRPELGTELCKAVAAQTRWTVAVLTVLGALFTTATTRAG